VRGAPGRRPQFPREYGCRGGGRVGGAAAELMSAGFGVSSSSPVSVLVGAPSMWHSGGAHGALRRCSGDFKLLVPGGLRGGG
jgi:rhodanese-related sulfurtransferase